MRVQFFLSYTTAVIETICFGGIIYGWGPLSYILQRENYFNSSCNEQPSNQTSYCYSQQEKLELVFTIANFVGSISSLPIGFILDKFGSWVIRTIGAVFFLMGFLITALTSQQESYVLYITMPMILFAGFVILFSNIPAAHFCPKLRGLSITLINGSFEASSVMFVLAKLAYDNGISFKAILYFFAFCSVLIFLRTFCLVPRYQTPYRITNDFVYGMKELCTNTNDDSKSSETVPFVHDNNVENRSLKSAIFSLNFLFNTLFLGLLQLRGNFFTGTINPWLMTLIHKNVLSTQSHYINVFGLMQFGTFLVTPLSGAIIDLMKWKFRNDSASEQISDQKAVSLSLGAATLVGVLFSCFVIIPTLKVQYFSFVLSVFFRSFVYGSYSSFIVICFPSKHFGVIYGLSELFGSLFAVLQFPLFYVLNQYLNGDFVVINILLLFTTAITIIHPLRLYVQATRAQNELQTNSE